MPLKELLQKYLQVDEDKRRQAIHFLACHFYNQDKSYIKEQIKKDPERWWVDAHLGWGMHLRNLLRDNGYDEKYFGIDNLDDIYINLVEESVEI